MISLMVRADVNTPKGKLISCQDNVQECIASDLQIKSILDMSDTEYVFLNGISHAINVRDGYKGHPVVLYLHGGPGWPISPLSYRYFKEWEDSFTLIHWDQRGAGKTLCENKNYDPSTATFDDFYQDTVAMVKHLRGKYKKDKIIILGHSWGSLLGIHLVKNHPEWVSAYIGTGQIAYNWEQEKSGYKFVLREAYARDDIEGIKELEALKPYPDTGDYISKLFVQRKYIAKYGGSLSDSTSFLSYYYTAYFESPDYTQEDWACFFDAVNGNYHNALMVRQYAKDSEFGNLPALGYDFEVPMLFFLGEHDEHISARLGAEYFANIKAPYKKLVLFSNSAHAPPLEEPKAFLKALVDYVLPEVEKNMNKEDHE